jgi:hypothetical protein
MRRVLTPALAAALGLMVIGVARGAVIVGTPGPDRLNGTSRADELYGLGGNDRLAGRGANDLIDGGPGRDRLSGGPGADSLAANDRQADAVLCGSGPDIVNADRNDAVAPDCETVSRRLSRDMGTNFEAQHETQVEPDSFSNGSTIVTVFPVRAVRERRSGADRLLHLAGCGSDLALGPAARVLRARQRPGGRVRRRPPLVDRHVARRRGVDRREPLS